MSDIKSLVQWEVQYNFALMQQLGASVTSSAIMMNATFPYLTQPHFEIIGGFVDGMGGIMCAAFAPLITAEDVPAWQEYSVANQGWIKESKWLKQIDEQHQDALHGTIQDHEHDRRRLQEEEEVIEPISPYLYRWENGSHVPVDIVPGQMYAPVWQVSPPDEGTVNSDVLQDPLVHKLFDQVQAMNRSILSPATGIGDFFGFLFDPEEEPIKVNPYAFIVQPVYDKFEVNKTLVGLLLAVTSYENLLDKLMPDGKRGIIAVIRDSCGTNITYFLNGLVADFWGYEDLHDPDFDSYKQSTSVELYDLYTNVTEGVCVHTLDVYPSVVFRETYHTNKPAVYTSIVVMAFIVTSILLVVYDVMVTRRQEKTMVSAIRSGKLVASLFPSTVVDRVMDDANVVTDKKPSNNSKKLAFLNDSNSRRPSLEEDDEGFFKTRPIADLYVALFANLRVS